jgi:hypothetical protein
MTSPACAHRPTRRDRPGVHIGRERALRVALPRACSNVVVTENPVQNVTFPSNGGTAHGYLAVPESGSGPGLVVIQEWWGLTTHIKDVTDRFAAEGFVAWHPTCSAVPRPTTPTRPAS